MYIILCTTCLEASVYAVQAARDRYRDIAAAGDGINWNLVRRFIEVSTVFLHVVT